MTETHQPTIVRELCEARRLRVAQIIHLGALAAAANETPHTAEEQIEDLLESLEGKSAAHVLEAIPGLRETYDAGTEDESSETVDDVWGFLNAALENDKLGFIIKVESPVLTGDADDEGSWGYCTIGYFYGETFESAVFDAAKLMPALCDRRPAAPSHAKEVTDA